MRARLGFAIATAVDPDILLLDEVHQTGDEVFREKSRQRIISVLQAAKAVVLVTHDMTWVTEFCTRALLIEDGRIVLDGAPDEVVRTHREHSQARRAARREQIELMRRGEIAIDPAGVKRLEEPPRRRRRP
jgi:ABC-type polysaccharide/polyol phosphate transport system ATPase subunit